MGDPTVQWLGPDGVSIISDTRLMMTSDSTKTYVSTLEFTLSADVPWRTVHLSGLLLHRDSYGCYSAHCET